MHGRRRQAAGRGHPRLAACLLAIAALLLAASQLGAATGTSTTTTLRDLTGRSVVPDEPDLRSTDTGDAGLTLRIPRVDLDVPARTMLESDGTITPPGFTAVYLVDNRGVRPEDARSGTVYAATHSLRDGVAPGNFLIDSASGAVRIGPGDDVLLGALAYRVTSVVTVAKTDLPGAASVWDDVPGRLVLITCVQEVDGSPSRANLVVEASLVRPVDHVRDAPSSPS